MFIILHNNYNIVHDKKHLPHILMSTEDRKKRVNKCI